MYYGPHDKALRHMTRHDNTAAGVHDIALPEAAQTDNHSKFASNTSFP